MKELKPADIVFARKRGPMSWFIRFLDGSFDYSHTCIIGEGDSVFTTGFGGNGPKTLGILPDSQFRQLPLKAYLANKIYEIRRYSDLSVADRQKITEWCSQQVGQKYPFFKTIVLFWDLVRRHNTSRINIQPDKQHCWELVARAYQAAGVELNPAAGNKAASGYDARELYESPGLVIFKKSAIF